MVNINITHSRIKLQSLSGIFLNSFASKCSTLQCDFPRAYAKSMFYRLVGQALAGRVHTQLIRINASLGSDKLFSESLVSFLKYADDVVIGHPCRDAQGLSIISNALKYVSEWSGQNGLNLNPNKCVQCTFSLIGNAVIDPDLKATVNDNALSTVDTFTNLGVTVARNAKWTNHVEGIFRKCVHLSFFAKKLRSLSTPAEYIRKFAEACVIPIILYCSPTIFPELLKQGFALLRRSIKLISYVRGLSFSYLTNLVCEHHVKASSDFAEWILADSEHALHEELSNARSHTSTRSRFKQLPSKTAAYRNSVLPLLSRLLIDRNAELNYYIQELS